MKAATTIIPKTLRDLTFVLVKPRSKKAFEEGWHKTARYKYGDPKLMDHLKARGNYGISGDDIISIDADTAVIREILETKLPPTFTRDSPGHPEGCACVYRGSITPPKYRLRIPKAGGGWDFIGEVMGRGGQIVGPGSIHPNGKKYNVLRDLPPAFITEEQIGDALGEYIEPDTKEDEKLKDADSAKVKTYGLTSPISIADVCSLEKLRKVGDEYVGAHPVHGSDTGENFHVNPISNLWHCFRHGTGGGPISLFAVLNKYVDCDKMKKGSGSLKGRKFREVLAAMEKAGLKVSSDSPLIKYFDDRERFVPKLLADELMREFKFKTHRESHEVYVESGGVFEPRGEELVAEECRKRLGEHARGWHVSEVVRHITETTYTAPEKFEAPSHLLNTGSGVLDLKTMQIIEPSEDLIFLNKIPAKFDPNAKCPNISKFFSEVLAPEDVPLIQEIVGYCLLRDYPFHRAVMLLGSGANGKSTFLNLIRALVGERNARNVSLQTLLYDRFATADLFGSMVNLYADLPTTKLSATGIFKMLVGEDRVRAQRKHRDPFNFVNYAKQLFSTNELPQTDDISAAWWRRWILISFNNTFPEGGPNTDPHLLRKLTTDEELSGLLTWALAGLERLVANGGFTMTKTRGDIEAEWVARSDSLRAFTSKFAEFDRSACVMKDDFLESYSDFCAENDLVVVDSSTVGKRLPVLIPRVLGKKISFQKVRVPVWMGLALTAPYHGKVWEQNDDGVRDVRDILTILWHKREKKEKGDSKGEEMGIQEGDNEIPIDIPDMGAEKTGQQTLDTGAESPTPPGLRSGDPTLSDPTLTDLKKRLYDHFGFDKPFTPKECLPLLGNGEAAKLPALFDKMRLVGELMMTPDDKFQLVRRASP